MNVFLCNILLFCQASTRDKSISAPGTPRSSKREKVFPGFYSRLIDIVPEKSNQQNRSGSAKTTTISNSSLQPESSSLGKVNRNLSNLSAGDLPLINAWIIEA